MGFLNQRGGMFFFNLFILFLLYFLFIFGCIGSLLLRVGFPYLGRGGILFIAVCRLLIMGASLVAEHGL